MNFVLKVFPKTILTMNTARFDDMINALFLYLWIKPGIEEN